MNKIIRTVEQYAVYYPKTNTIGLGLDCSTREEIELNMKGYYLDSPYYGKIIGKTVIFPCIITLNLN